MSKLFLGGIPTAPDVKRIRETLGDLPEGSEIPHSWIEEIINCKSDSSRYRSVTMVWRKTVLREQNIEIDAVPGVGFRVLVGAERINRNYSKFRSASKLQGRAVRRIGSIPDAVLTSTDRARRDLIYQNAARAVETAALVAKQIEPPKPVSSSIPRLAPTSTDDLKGKP